MTIVSWQMAQYENTTDELYLWLYDGSGAIVTNNVLMAESGDGGFFSVEAGTLATEDMQAVIKVLAVNVVENTLFNGQTRVGIPSSSGIDVADMEGIRWRLQLDGNQTQPAIAAPQQLSVDIGAWDNTALIGSSMVENDGSGDMRWTAKALEESPVTGDAPTVQQIVTGWGNEPQSSYVTPGTFGYYLDARVSMTGVLPGYEASQQASHLDITRGVAFTKEWDAGTDIDGLRTFVTLRARGDDGTGPPLFQYESVGVGQIISLVMLTEDTNKLTASSSPCDVRFDALVEMEPSSENYIGVVPHGTVTVYQTTTYPPV